MIFRKKTIKRCGYAKVIAINGFLLSSTDMKKISIADFRMRAAGQEAEMGIRTNCLDDQSRQCRNSGGRRRYRKFFVHAIFHNYFK